LKDWLKQAIFAGNIIRLVAMGQRGGKNSHFAPAMIPSQQVYSLNQSFSHAANS